MKTFNIIVSGRTMGDAEAALRRMGNDVCFDECSRSEIIHPDFHYKYTSEGQFETQKVIKPT